MNFGWWRTLHVDDVNEVMLLDGWHTIVPGTLIIDETLEMFKFQQDFPPLRGARNPRIMVGSLSSLLSIAAPPQTPPEA